VYHRTNEDYETIIYKINTNTKTFIATYPDSEYIKLLESYELEPSKWGYGVGVNFGYSAKIGDISKFFSKNDGAMDLYIDIAYKNYLATTGIFSAFSNAREDIIREDGVILPKDISANIINFYLSFGYRFFDDKRIKITPIAGIGTARINPGSEQDRKDNSELKQFNYSYGLTTNFGIMADIRLGKMKNIPGQNFINPTFYGVRVSYKFFHNNLMDVPTLYNGNLHTITVGVNFFIRSTNQVKYK
jgi:hypothetical protein